MSQSQNLDKNRGVLGILHKNRLITILRPDFCKDEKRRPLPIPKCSDYIRVPAILTRGTFNLPDCMSFEDLAKLAILRRTLEERK